MENTTNNEPILVTGAAGKIGAVGRAVTGLLLERGLAVRAMVRREDDRAAALRAAGAEVVVGDPLEPADVYGSLAAVGESTSVCPCPPGTWRRP
jgi:nucleoside-diphosphate-sugar epimerase